MKKLFLCLLMLLCCAAVAVAEDTEVETYTDGAYEYILTDEGAVVTDYLWSDTLPDVIEVPVSLDSMPVIGFEYVFASSNWRQDGVKIIVPEGITTIGNAFVECTAVTEIVLPSSLEHIPEDAFTWVDAEIILHPDNPHFVNENGFLIDVQTDTIIYTEVNCGDNPIPAVRRIGAGSMDNWGTEWGQDMVIPEGVEEIGEYAFYDWELSRVTLPESLRLIESHAFNVGIIEPVILPAGVEMVQRWAFSGYGRDIESNIEVIATSDATHFETADEYEARTGYRHWMDDWAEE